MPQRFSDRVGATAPRKNIQVDSIDDILRAAIWNSLSLTIDMADAKTAWYVVGRAVAQKVFKLAADAPFIVARPREWLRRLMLETAAWYDVYNVVEQVAVLIEMVPGHKLDRPAFERLINGVLSEELAGYRFVGGMLTPISDRVERDTVETAVSDSKGESRFAQARQHLATSLTLISKKPRPDYRNSMKEAISAVESAVRSAPGVKDSKFRNALRTLTTQLGIHPVLQDAFTKLYEYTSDEDGVRHAMIDTPTVGLAEAKFLLVASSAFVNFLATKEAELPDRAASRSKKGPGEKPKLPRDTKGEGGSIP